MIMMEAKRAEKVINGDRYFCDKCGLAVTVDNSCTCGDLCDLNCCGVEMTLEPVIIWCSCVNEHIKHVPITTREGLRQICANCGDIK
jgi:hypothetical protein